MKRNSYFVLIHFVTHDIHFYLFVVLTTLIYNYVDNEIENVNLDEIVDNVHIKYLVLKEINWVYNHVTILNFVNNVVIILLNLHMFHATSLRNNILIDLVNVNGYKEVEKDYVNKNLKIINITNNSDDQINLRYILSFISTNLYFFVKFFQPYSKYPC